jgi:Trypsin-like serine proteases, typically periplasmic, contain C-terminal PDZ domain
VSPGTPAERGGIRLGDRLLAVNHQPLADQNDMVRQLADAADAITLTVDRQGQLLDLRLTAEGDAAN